MGSFWPGAMLLSLIHISIGHWLIGISRIGRITAIIRITRIGRLIGIGRIRRIAGRHLLGHSALRLGRGLSRCGRLLRNSGCGGLLNRSGSSGLGSCRSGGRLGSGSGLSRSFHSFLLTHDLIHNLLGKLNAQDAGKVTVHHAIDGQAEGYRLSLIHI